MTDEELLERWRVGALRVTELTARQHAVILEHFYDEEV